MMILIVGIGSMIVSPSSAFLYQISILNKNQISELSNETLLDTYIDVLVELEASQAFHQTSGFTPKQYLQHKDLLKYRIRLVDEIQKRGLDVPGAIKAINVLEEDSAKPEPKKSTLIIKNQ